MSLDGGRTFTTGLAIMGCIFIRVTRIGSHIFRILVLENSGIKGFKNRKVYTTLILTKMWQYIR